MKTLTENIDNIAVLSEIEMSKIFGGDNTTASTTVEDEDAWM